MGAAVAIRVRTGKLSGSRLPEIVESIQEGAKRSGELRFGQVSIRVLGESQFDVHDNGPHARINRRSEIPRLSNEPILKSPKRHVAPQVSIHPAPELLSIHDSIFIQMAPLAEAAIPIPNGSSKTESSTR